MANVGTPFWDWPGWGLRMDGIVWDTLHVLDDSAPEAGLDSVIVGKMEPSGRNEAHFTTGPMGTRTIGSVRAYVSTSQHSPAF